MAKWEITWWEKRKGYAYGKDPEDVEQNAEITDEGEFVEIDYSSVRCGDLIDREDEKPDCMDIAHRAKEDEMLEGD